MFPKSPTVSASKPHSPKNPFNPAPSNPNHFLVAVQHVAPVSPSPTVSTSTVVVAQQAAPAVPSLSRDTEHGSLHLNTTSGRLLFLLPRCPPSLWRPTGSRPGSIRPVPY